MNTQQGGDSPDVRLEHRLTKIEAGQVALKTQVEEMDRRIVTRLDTSNARMAEHFASDAVWFAAHDQDAARGRGFRDGAFWLLGGIVTFGSVAGGLIGTFL